MLQFCALSALLSALVYYLTTDNICGQTGLQSTTSLGKQLTAASGKQHVLVTGGAGYIGSHAALRLLEDGHAVTVLDNLSRGNKGAVDVLQGISAPGSFQFVEADIGHGDVVKEVFRRCRFDLVMHFAAVAYVGAHVATWMVQGNNTSMWGTSDAFLYATCYKCAHQQALKVSLHCRLELSSQVLQSCLRTCSCCIEAGMLSGADVDRCKPTLKRVRSVVQASQWQSRCVTTTTSPPTWSTCWKP